MKYWGVFSKKGKLVNYGLGGIVHSMKNQWPMVYIGKKEAKSQADAMNFDIKEVEIKIKGGK
jgi:hypothetical protein